MASTPSTFLRVELQGLGDNLNSWGFPKLNDALARLEEGISDVRTIATTGGTYALTSANYIADEARAAAFIFTGTGGTVTYPVAGAKVCRLYNNSTGSITFKYAASGAGVVLLSGEGCDIVGNATEFYKAGTSLFDASTAFSTTSTTANAIGTGSKTYAVATGKALAAGINVRVADNAAPATNYMDGVVTGNSSGSLVVNVTNAVGSGTPAAVTISFAQAQVNLPNQAGHAGQVLSTDGTLLSWGAMYAPSVQEFTASGTWTKPAGASFIAVEVHGAGGGGGSGYRVAAGSTPTGGAGGGGGERAYQIFKAADLSASVTVTIGAGGAGGAAITTDSTFGLAGSAGGNTTFGAYMTAHGGGGGGGGSSSSAVGGQGGFPTGWTSAKDTPGSTPGIFSAGTVGTGAGLSAMYGGGNGAGATPSAPNAGGSSFYGGGGGGNGASLETNGAVDIGGAGGGNKFSTAVPGSAGAGSSPGGAGGALCGGGGGGAIGGAGPGSAAGGAGGIAGGGGGGGASVNGTPSGAGGAGGAGRARIYTW